MSEEQTFSKNKTALIIFVAAVAVFMAGQQALEFIRIDCRFGMFVYEMANKLGPFPVLYDKSYMDYPSTHTLLMYLSSLIFDGRVDMMSLTLPSALAAAGVVTLTYLIGTRQSSRFGLFAALLLGGSYEFLAIARTPSPDMFVALFTIAAFHVIYTAELDHKYWRLWFVPLLLLCSFAIRGPIGVVIPAAVIFIFHITGRKYITAIFSGVISAAVLAGCMGLFLWIVYQFGGKEMADSFLDAQVYGRIEKGQPIWFYFTNALGSYSVAYPLAAVVIATYAWRLRKKYFSLTEPGSADRLRQYLTAWMLIILLGMSIPGTKHLRYVVAAIPAMALLGAFLFENPDEIPLFTKIRNIIIPVCRFLPPVAAAGICIAALVLRQLDSPLQLPVFLPVLMLLTISIAIIAFPRKIRSKDKAVLFIVALTLAGFLVLRLMIIEPVEQYLEGARKFVSNVERIRTNDLPVCFLGIGPDNEDVRYMVNVDRKKSFMPVFLNLNQPEELLKLAPGTLIIMKENKQKHLPENIRKRFRVVFEGSLGHRKCVVFISKGIPEA
ncbi:MAG: glycosyltransferase family 39 protein [Victivallaceae bacterium]